MSFIKLDRKIIDSEIFANAEQLKFWLWLLMKANYKDRFVSIKVGAGQTTVNVKRGDLIFGRNSASDALGINAATLYIWLQKFKSLEMVTLKANKHFTLVTICKYNNYQTDEEDKVTTNSQPNNNQLDTISPPINTPKEVKEIKENINTVTPPFDFKQALLNSGANEQHVIDFMAARKKKRLANTRSAFDLFQKEATKLNKTIPEAVEFCAGRSWGGLRAEYVEKETTQQGLNYLSGQLESDLIAKINGITDEFLLDVEMSKFQFNDQFTVLYHTELQKFISWDTMVKCPKIGKVARSIFTARSINHLLTPATYGQRNKTA